MCVMHCQAECYSKFLGFFCGKLLESWLFHPLVTIEILWSVWKHVATKKQTNQTKILRPCYRVCAK